MQHSLRTESERAQFEGGLEQAAEQMSAIDQLQEAWRSLPPDLKQDLQRRGLSLWDLRGIYLARFLATVNALFLQNPVGWQQAFLQNRAASVDQLARLAGQMARLPVRAAGPQPGMSYTQVREYQRRQQARGFVPGRQRQNRRLRELELEVALDTAGRELEAAEQFWTKVTRIPGVGNKEGHEILTRHAVAGLLPPAEAYHVQTGVIRPDRGGRSYWRFPRSAVESLKAAAQPSHSLRPTPSTTTAAALRSIQARFAGLYRRAMLAPTRQAALEWLGEALHLLQDSFSSAHVDRAGGAGRIQRIRAFYIRLGWPPLSRQPDEHNAPSDDRDNIYDPSGALRPQARAAVAASRHFLVMALRHLSAPQAPTHGGELAAFLRRYLA
jgi:hypothetical protein